MYSGPFLFGQIVQMHRPRERDRERGAPPRQDKMKEDGRAARFLDGHSRGPTLWTVMDCLYAWLPLHLILFIPPAPWALRHPIQGHGGVAGVARPMPAACGSPWWSRAGPITARSEVISTAPSGRTLGVDERSRGGGQKRTIAWDSERGRGNRGFFLCR